jgi:hypothetical protein
MLKKPEKIYADVEDEINVITKPEKIYTDVEEINFVNNKNDEEMGRVNKLTEGVFTEILGNANQISKPDMFAEFGKNLNSTEDLNKFTEQYKFYVQKIDLKMEILANLEVVIMQLRARNNVEDIKLSIVREYIYARCPFYREDKVTKDIRVIVGNVEFHGDNIDNLLGDTEFMNKAKEKLIRAMGYEIEKNITEYNKKKDKIYNN